MARDGGLGRGGPAQEPYPCSPTGAQKRPEESCSERWRDLPEVTQRWAVAASSGVREWGKQGVTPSPRTLWAWPPPAFHPAAGKPCPRAGLGPAWLLSLPRLFLKLNFLKTGWLIRKRTGLVSGWEELTLPAVPGLAGGSTAGLRGLPSPPAQSSHHPLKVLKALEGSGVLEGAAGGTCGHQAVVGHTDPHPNPRPACSLARPLLVWVLDIPGGRARLSLAIVWIGQEECGHRGDPGYEAGDPEASPGEADPGRTS